MIIESSTFEHSHIVSEGVIGFNVVLGYQQCRAMYDSGWLSDLL